MFINEIPAPDALVWLKIKHNFYFPFIFHAKILCKIPSTWFVISVKLLNFRFTEQYDCVFFTRLSRKDISRPERSQTHVTICGGTIAMSILLDVFITNCISFLRTDYLFYREHWMKRKVASSKRFFFKFLVY